MSVARTRNGANRDQEPSQGCAINESKITSISTSHRVAFEVTGPARLAGVGNGDPHCHEPDHAANRSAFRGLARAVLRSSGAKGTVTLRATAEGLKPGQASVEAA